MGKTPETWLHQVPTSTRAGFCTSIETLMFTGYVLTPQILLYRKHELLGNGGH